MSTGPHDQKEAQRFEQDLNALRQALSGPGDVEPPELLDRAVLNTARRAVGTGRGRTWLPKRWLGAVATAAVVVIALTVVMQQDQPVPVPLPEETNGFRLDQESPSAQMAEKSEGSRKISARVAAPAAPKEESADSSDPVPNAESWINRMLQLKASQQEEELANELEAFRSVFPDHPLPPELEP